jgi:hypothetical protein
MVSMADTMRLWRIAAPNHFRLGSRKVRSAVSSALMSLHFGSVWLTGSPVALVVQMLPKPEQ